MIVEYYRRILYVEDVAEDGLALLYERCDVVLWRGWPAVFSRFKYRGMTKVVLNCENMRSW